MRTILGLAFDLEGTMVDVEEAHHKAHLQIAGELGLSLTLDDCLHGVVLPHFIGGPDDQIYREMLALAGREVDPAEVAALVERKKALYRQNLASITVEPRPGWHRIFMQAIQLGLQVSVGSLTAKEEAEVLLSRSGVGDLFHPSRIILREDVVNPKPAPDVFLMTAERMGISPTEQLVFEDSPRGMQAALTAGSVAVGMPVYSGNNAVNAALYKAGARFTFASWEDINLPRLLASL